MRVKRAAVQAEALWRRAGMRETQRLDGGAPCRGPAGREGHLEGSACHGG